MVLRKGKTNLEFWGCSRFPKCHYSLPLTKNDYLCDEIVKGWSADFSSISDVTQLCQSDDEKKYLFGAAYYLCDGNRNPDMNSFIDITTIKLEYKGNIYLAAQFSEVFEYWHGPSPTSMAFVPQLAFGHSLHHDFGIFFSNEQYPITGQWEFGMALEVDEHPYHNCYAARDEFRDSIVDYLVLRVRSKTDPWSSWFHKVESIYSEGTYRLTK